MTLGKFDSDSQRHSSSVFCDIMQPQLSGHIGKLRLLSDNRRFLK